MTFTFTAGTIDYGDDDVVSWSETVAHRLASHGMWDDTVTGRVVSSQGYVWFDVYPHDADTEELWSLAEPTRFFDSVSDAQDALTAVLSAARFVPGAAPRRPTNALTGVAR